MPPDKKRAVLHSLSSTLCPAITTRHNRVYALIPKNGHRLDTIHIHVENCGVLFKQNVRRRLVSLIYRVTIMNLPSKSVGTTLNALIIAAVISVSPFAYAKKHKKYDYSGCSSSSSNQSESCNSPLGESTYDLVNDGVFMSMNPSSSSINIDGVNISMSAFSDTNNVYNETVVSANLEKISDTWAYGVTNNDEKGFSGGADHAIDNINYYGQGSYAAHYSGMTNVERDYDFVLLSFDKAVTLTGASFSWIYSSSDTQVSVAALGNTSSLTSGVNTWSDIVADALTSSSFDIEACEYLDHRANFNFSESAQYWLVGAYNTVFGNIGGTVGNDAFKLANIGFAIDEESSPGNKTQVSEPSTVGIIMACSLFIVWRRKRQSTTL